MKALIDADIFQYEFGNATDSEYKPLAWPLVQARVQSRIDKIMEATGADSYQLYLTTDDKSNFRYKIATIRPYKGNRPSEKPYWYHHIRNFLVDQRGAQEVSGMEADDALSIEQWKDYITAIQEQQSIFSELSRGLKIKDLCSTIICSRDKDLDMVPGWHYNWGAGNQKEKPMWWQDETNGLRCFYKQLLTGDSVDNISGLYGVGANGASVLRISDMVSEHDMYNHVFCQYQLRFGSYAEQFLLENARLLWMLREEGELWEPPDKR
jgi:hypothetical protein